jgi:low temperature requirement protein LtrA
MRDGERVSPLELFFDLVFVLAITQCTALMADQPNWTGLGRALVVLGLLWWAWVGYAWLTSVIDPESGSSRLVIFAAMAALLIASLCVPDAFGDLGLTLAIALIVVRTAHIAVFVIASREDPGFRHSTTGLACTTAIAGAILVAGTFLDPPAQLAVWVAALAFDMAGPAFIDTRGWRLVPEHFAERHGLILIVALGESIVAIGVGAEGSVDTGVIVAAVLGVALAAAMWWMYFDVAALAATERLVSMHDVKERNELARDAYSYLHLPLVAAIVLVAFGLKTTIAHIDEPLHWESAAALAGGTALYVLGHVAFKYRTLHTISYQRLVTAIVLAALIPVVHQTDAIVGLAIIVAVCWSMILYETIRFATARGEVRQRTHEHE